MTSEVIVVAAPAPCTLEQLAERIRPALAEAGVLRAVVFGSWARGSADGFSDLDLAVVLETELPSIERPRLLAGVHRALPGIGVDIVVYTPEEWERGIATGLDLFDSIRREGVTIHARPGA
jgi:predicted nucleotidyltransferase